MLPVCDSGPDSRLRGNSVFFLVNRNQISLVKMKNRQMRSVKRERDVLSKNGQPFGFCYWIGKGG